MLENISHSSAIVTYNDINYKIEIKRWWNSSSTIFRIASASILLDLPSEFFGISCSSDYSTLLSSAFYFLRDFEYRTIPVTTLDIVPRNNACPLEDYYILIYYLFCQTISYLTVLFNLFSLFPHMAGNTISHIIDCCVIV